jgi:hypoxanthine phosphoribosyltransferase
MVTLYDQGAIARRVAELAGMITRDHAADHPEPVIIGVLKGSWIFMADLVRHLEIPVVCDFIRVRSYDNGTVSSGRPTLLMDVTTELAGRRVILVDDIIDTGLTARFMLEHLGRKGPVDIEICALFDKPSRRRVPVTARYVGFSIPDRFIVGYGLDVDERYRHLPYVGMMEPEE